MAGSAAGTFSYPTGRAGAEALGYDPASISAADPELLASFCGVGNPFSLGPIHPGEHVLDVGCGAGFDLLVASRLAGENGRVCGIDLTEEMAARAGDSLGRAGRTNVEVKHVDAEEIPYEDCRFDVVVSNGVVNLSPCKQTLLREINRVLKPGGRFQLADVMLEREQPGGVGGSADAWAQ